MCRECYKAGLGLGRPEQEWTQLYLHCFRVDLNVDDGAPSWLTGTTPVLRTSTTLGALVFRAQTGSGGTRQAHQVILCFPGNKT